MIGNNKRDEIKNYIPPTPLNFFTKFYDIGCILMGLGKKFRFFIVQNLKLSGKERILDAGCGTGTLLLILKKIYPSITAEGLDPDSNVLNIAKKKFEKNGINITLYCSKMDNMPFEDNSFDVLVSSLAFHHIKKEERMPSLGECLRILKPRGKMLLIDFGPPDSNFFNRILSILMGFFELIEDGKKGRIPLLMKEAEFSEVKHTAKYLHNIAFYEGYKF
ncbi:MAG: methyltransferase domain-containing protein [Acidobacteriota bacterium]